MRGIEIANACGCGMFCARSYKHFLCGFLRVVLEQRVTEDAMLLYVRHSSEEQATSYRSGSGPGAKRNI